jgi:pimeloyl-ACP methyl ester carboxylesterase
VDLLARWCAHHGYGVLAVDLPGHGQSAGPVLPSVEATADWLLACWTPPACSATARSRWSATAWAR